MGMDVARSATTQDAMARGTGGRGAPAEDRGARLPGSIARPAFRAGLALGAMALLAPLGVLLAIPAGMHALGAAAVLVIAALDVAVGIWLLPLLATGSLALARVSAGARILYGLAFAGAALVLLATSDAALFTRIWDAALGIFAVHLLLAGAALVRSPCAPVWLGVLVGLAGIGYGLDAVRATTGFGIGLTLAEVLFLGELALLVWLLVRGRPRRRDEP